MIETCRWHLWRDAPKDLTDALIASHRFDDMAVSKPAIILRVNRKHFAHRQWHHVVPEPLLVALNTAYRNNVIVENACGMIARVWFDVVGITL